MQLDELQIELLDRFVAEQAGGLIVVAGPVNTPEWAGQRRGRDPRIDTIKALYPVVFYSQGVPSLGLGRFGGEAAWPLSFTRDGARLPSSCGWKTIRSTAKRPGSRLKVSTATTPSRTPNREHVSTPVSRIRRRRSTANLPIYAAAHFYGAGRVFFQASGEMWRLRAVEPRYFETYYTKLIRWVSQGRLLRDSSRGVLLVDKDRCLLGDQVTIRAVLSDVQHQPLKLDSVPAILLQPDGQRAADRLAQSPGLGSRRHVRNPVHRRAGR